MGKWGLILVLLASGLLPAEAVLAGPVHPKAGGGAVQARPHRGPADAETEPNDDCTQADGPVATGIGYEGEITSGDEDWYAFAALGGERVVFRTRPTPGQGDMDTVLRLYAGDCTTLLFEQDDISDVDLFSFFQVHFAAAGTYYVVVFGYAHSATGHYTLTAESYPAAPNDDCATAIDLHDQDLQEFDVDTCTGSNLYDPGPDNCDPGVSWDMAGPDLVYSIELFGGETFSVTLGADWDGALYLVNSCADVSLSCVAIADGEYGGEPETFSYAVLDAGTYYLIVDAEAQCGPAHVVINSPVGGGTGSWGALKSLYR